jgi:hypothetical protein
MKYLIQAIEKQRKCTTLAETPHSESCKRKSEPQSYIRITQCYSDSEAPISPNSTVDSYVFAFVVEPVPAFASWEYSMFMRRWLAVIGGIIIVQLAPNVINWAGAS